MSNEIDLSIALRKIHELSQQDGDLGNEYWSNIGKLLSDAAAMQEQINHLNNELMLCKGKLGHASKK